MRCAGPALNRAAGKDEVFRDLVLARIIEPTTKVDSLRVLAETGVESVCYRRSSAACPATPRPAGATRCRRHARLMPGWA